MKKKKNLRINPILFILLLITMLWLNPLISVFGQEQSSSYAYTGTLKCENPDIWTNEQWQFYQVSVDLTETVSITLDYNGSLDIDTRAYWKRDNPDVPNFNGFDLSHCSLDNYIHADNSQLRTNSTPDYGQNEEMELVNPSYTKVDDQLAYILVFVYNGTGEANYTLRATKELINVDHTQVYDCNMVIMTLIIYLILAGSIVGIIFLLVKRKKKKITKPKKPKEKEQRTETEKKGMKHVDLDTVL